MSRKKIILLRSAARRGPASFIRQLCYTGLDVAVRRKHLVFRLPADRLGGITTPPGIAFQCHRIQGWEDLPADLRHRLEDRAENIEWGARTWFDLDRQLWVGLVGERIACMAWTVGATAAKGFFFPLPPRAEVLYQTVTLPEFRGNNLQVRFCLELMRLRAADGIEEFFIASHEYNHTSYRNILKMGFSPFGHCREGRLSRRRTWHGPRQMPEASLDQ